MSESLCDAYFRGRTLFDVSRKGNTYPNTKKINVRASVVCQKGEFKKHLLGGSTSTHAVIPYGSEVEEDLDNCTS